MERSPDTNISPSLGGFGASQVESIVSCWDGGSSPSRSDKVDTSPHFSLFTLAMLQNPGNHPAVTHDGTMGEGPATLLQGRYIPYEPLHDSAHMMHEAPPRPTSSENLPALNPDPQSVTWSSNSIPYGSEHKLTEKRHWSPPMRDSAPVSHGPFPALNRMTDSIEARISNAPYHTLLEYNLESSHNDESAYYGTLHRHEISPRVSGSNSVYLHSLPDAIAASLPSAASPAQPHEATVEPLLLRVPEDRSRGRKLNRSRSDPGLASPSRRNGRSRNSTRYEAGLDVSTHAHNKPLRRAATVGKKHTLDGCWDCRERKKVRF
ncbi:hypothetical protein DL93DRAFT_578583 [Clavulina sp. PMI_390]|nr:hypothetical protein DL93DRAFT_578583 [Clavulina sp. PMI_390]